MNSPNVFDECAGWDPEEPVCARVTLGGTMTPVSSDMLAFAKRSLFSRHPAMAEWPTSHGKELKYDC